MYINIGNKLFHHMMARGHNMMVSDPHMMATNHHIWTPVHHMRTPYLLWFEIQWFRKFRTKSGNNNVKEFLQNSLYVMSYFNKCGLDHVRVHQMMNTSHDIMYSCTSYVEHLFITLWTKYSRSWLVSIIRWAQVNLHMYSH